MWERLSWGWTAMQVGKHLLKGANNNSKLVRRLVSTSFNNDSLFDKHRVRMIWEWQVITWWSLRGLFGSAPSRTRIGSLGERQGHNLSTASKNSPLSQNDHLIFFCCYMLHDLPPQPATRWAADFQQVEDCGTRCALLKWLFNVTAN